MKSVAELLFLPLVRLAWTFVIDLTPKKTLDEFAFALDNVRHHLFNQDDQELQQKLTNQLLASRATYSALVVGGSSAAVVSAQAERVRTFERLLGVSSSQRDIYLGSLGAGIGPNDQFPQVSQHPTTVGFLFDSARSVAGRVFEDKTLRERTFRLKERVLAEQQILTQVRDLMTPAGQVVVDARLQALNIATTAILADDRSKSPSAMNSPAGIQTRRESIPIV